jgi:hypothetical protein
MGDIIGIEDHLARYVPRGATGRLNQTGFAS